MCLELFSSSVIDQIETGLPDKVTYLYHYSGCSAQVVVPAVLAVPLHHQSRRGPSTLCGSLASLVALVVAEKNDDMKYFRNFLIGLEPNF